jgi:amino acid adenylation domain-containing protein
MLIVMSDVAARLQELSPAGKRALLVKLLSLQTSRGKTAPLSYAQQRLWFLEQLVSGNPFYNESSAIRLLFPVDDVALEKSLSEIVRRHEALRTNFEAPDGEPRQRVLPPRPLELPVINLSDLAEEQREAEAIRLATEHARRPFDIAKGPLLRVALIRLAPSNHIFVLTMHHIVCDGWSMKVFFEELRVLYEAFVHGRPSPLPELTIQYTDFTVWQREWLRGSALEEQLEFWRGRLANLQTLDLPTDKPRPTVPTFSGGREPISIPLHVNRALQSLCEHESVTSFMALLAAFQVFLHRYTGQDDIAVGCPVANRSQPELEKLIGFFVNTLVMRTDISGNPTFRELLARIREVALSTYAHQDLPFERLVEELQPKRDPSRNPLFQVTFQLLSDNESEETTDQLRSVNVELLTSKFDLRCDLWHRSGGLTGYIEYSVDLFDAETVRLMARHFEALVASMVASPDQRVNEVRLSPAEEQKLLEWNNTVRSFPQLGCVHERFEKLASSYPARLAVTEGTLSIKYGELNRRANQLARHLKTCGIQPGYLVAVLFDRSIDLVVSILAILKVGAAYVPLDPSNPSERLSAMLNEALVPLVLTASRYQEKIPTFIRQFQVDGNWSACENEDDSDLPIHIDSRSLAYVIFTSGSTGKPRGVEVLHASLNNLVDWHQHEYQATPADRATLYASPGFDASVWEIWPYLTAGASLHIADAETHVSPTSLAQWMAKTGITISFLPTPVAENFIESELPDTLQLRVLLTGGDKLRHHPRRSLPFQFVNHYGPTENTVVATACDVKTDSSLDAPAIGKPISNVQAYVLDRYTRPVPVGVKGELYLGGAGLARGYLNHGQLTKEKFIPDPFDRRTGNRLYRTGDLVRYRSDGNLEFHGRVDGQIKIRGNRVEPGEIEAAIDRHPYVCKSLVLVQESSTGEKSLAAYLTTKQEETARQADLAQSVQLERVEEWQQMYEQLYDSDQPQRDHSFDIIGWNSSYTGRPLSKAEMLEQVTATVSRIATLGGKRILEIGCGTGLLLLRLAAGCKRYVGTDFSKVALAQVEQVVREQDWSHVELLQRRADDFSSLAMESFDVVVLNSVVQYFPSMEYVVQVLEKARRVVRPGGFIFVGDVRSLPLLPLLHAGIEVARANEAISVGELRGRIERRMKHEPELAIEPRFFHSLAVRAEGINGVAMEVKRGWHKNELTRFRYDVVLRVGSSAPTPAMQPLVGWEERQWEELGSVEALREYLRDTGPATLLVRAVPSARLRSERQRMKRLEQAEDTTPISNLRFEEATNATTAGSVAVEPEQLWALEDQLAYQIQVSWADQADVYGYDVKCVARSGLSEPLIWSERTAQEVGESSRPWSTYGNEVLTQPSEQYKAQRLRQYLREHLPEYMVPSRFLWVRELPMTRNGKLNRAALPAADRPRSDLNSAYSLPGNEVEAKLAGIWQEVLGLERVGVHDNFFDLGGHSLLLVKLHSRLTQLFDTSLSIIDLFRLPSVSALSRAISAERNGVNTLASALG